MSDREKDWRAAVSVEVPAGTHPDALTKMMAAFAERLSDLPYAEFGTQPEVLQGSPSWLKAEIVVRAAGDQDASHKATRAVESAADAAGLSITHARVSNVYQL